jgi:hypothetical protein
LITSKEKPPSNIEGSSVVEYAAMNQWLLPLYKWVGASHPTASLIGMFLVGGFLFGGMWYLTGREYQESLKKTLSAVLPDTKIPPNPANVSFIGTGPLVRNIKANAKMVSLDVDTAALKPATNDFYLILVLRAQDNSIDALTDPSIIKSRTFGITGEVRTLQVDLPEDFVKRAETNARKTGTLAIGIYIAIIPKHIRPEQILTIADITALGGKQLAVK